MIIYQGFISQHICKHVKKVTIETKFSPQEKKREDESSAHSGPQLIDLKVSTVYLGCHTKQVFMAGITHAGTGFHIHPL